ncbi:MAG: ComF family protein, partial [Candidatus Limnocylindrales bacterium]
MHEGSAAPRSEAGLPSPASRSAPGSAPARAASPPLRARISAALLDLAIPPACAGCGEEGTPLCGRCALALDARLALPPGVPIGLPKAMPATLAQLEWCAPFSGVVRRSLHRLKYSGERRLAGPLATAMARRWRAAGAGGELLVPVPIHAERARRRGYDQAVLLAEAASGGAGMPAAAVLERSRATCPQFELGRQARWSNVSGAFALRDADQADLVCGRWVVLVDDVVTTGSTLVACAEVLYAAGARAVSAVTVAR